MEAWEICDKAFRHGTGEKLKRLFKKSSEWWNSFRRQPKSDDYVNGTGNASPVTHYLEFIDRLEAVDAGVGVEVNRLTNAEVKLRYACDEQAADMMKNEVLHSLIKETSEAILRYNDCDVENASDDDLLKVDEELGQLIDAAQSARAHVRAVRRKNRCLTIAAAS